MAGELSIRQARAGDGAALSLIGAATFLETYAHMIPGADIVAHCAEKHAAGVYEAWIGDPSATVWIAETEVGAPVGYLVLTRATLPVEGPAPDDLEVQRIYVLTHFQKTGLGYALMNLALSRAREKGAARVVLGVHKENAKALAFYARHGFEPVAGRSFTVGSRVYCDHVMARRLR